MVKLFDCVHISHIYVSVISADQQMDQYFYPLQLANVDVTTVICMLSQPGCSFLTSAAGLAHLACKALVTSALALLFVDDSECGSCGLADKYCYSVLILKFQNAENHFCSSSYDFS